MSTPLSPFSPAAFSENLADVAASIRDSVVQVHAGQRGIGSGVVWPSATPTPTPTPLSPQGEGSGVRTQGSGVRTIITNAHVVHAAGNAELTIKHADGRHLKAEVLAIDPEHDLAALRVSAEGLQSIEVGDSSALRVGELVLAVGNPFGREGAVTVGVVAARAPAGPDVNVEPVESPDRRPGPGRGWPRFREMDLIQADLRLYPGNSGGPLADSHGRVVGINAMIGGGLAYAIPSRTVQAFLAETGHASSATPPLYLGIEVLTAPLPASLRQRHALAQETAVLVAGVEAGAAAEAAGVLVGDVLLAVDGVAVPDARLLPRLLRHASISQPRTLTLLRGGERVTITLTPQTRDSAAA
ncbi:MAG: S1C family serine protease [Ktedonobacterales bacterium]